MRDRRERAKRAENAKAWAWHLGLALGLVLVSVGNAPLVGVALLLVALVWMIVEALP